MLDRMTSAMKGLIWLSLLVVDMNCLELSSITGDVTAVEGDRVRMECGTERERRNTFTNCSWGGPDRERHFADVGGKNRINVYIERNDQYHLCVLEIDRKVFNHNF